VPVGLMKVLEGENFASTNFATVVDEITQKISLNWRNKTF
jgi:hypothetical protein